MNEYKPWYASRGLWAAVVTVACGIAGGLGYAVSEEEASRLMDLIIPAVTALAGIFAWIGRRNATKQIRKSRS